MIVLLPSSKFNNTGTLITTVPPPESGWSTDVVVPPFTLSTCYPFNCHVRDIIQEKYGKQHNAPDCSVPVRRISIRVVESHPLTGASSLDGDRHCTAVTYWVYSSQFTMLWSMRPRPRGGRSITYRGTRQSAHQRTPSWTKGLPNLPMSHLQPHTTCRSRPSMSLHRIIIH